jgi:hypothetical protein
MAASSADELLEELRKKAEKVSLTAVVSVAGLLLVGLGLIGLATESEPLLPRTLLPAATWGSIGLGLLVLLGLPWAAWWDRRTRRTTVNYEFDDLGANVREAIVRLVEAFQRAHSIWSVRSQVRHGDWKRHAGSTALVSRRLVRFGWGAPPRVATNVRVGRLILSEATLYLFPDRLLVYGNGGIRAIGYTDLTFEPETVRFVEDGDVPPDSVVVGTTWRYVNRDGGPDRRFNDNRQLPLVQYGVLDISAPAGLRLSLQVSTQGLAQGAAALLRLVQAAIQELRSRGASIQPTTSAGVESVEPPPLARPALHAARIGTAVVTYRWLAALPEWAVPIVWGLIFALPAVGALLLVVRGINGATGVFMAVALLMTGCGIPVLVGAKRRMAEERAAEEQKRRARFRAMLVSELRSRPPAQLDFPALALEAGVAVTEAESVAYELYRLFTDRVVADGVITPKEQHKLQLLAKVLRIEPEVAADLKSEAASARYRQAVSDVLADGVITAEESRMLDELRTSLGVHEP